MKRTATLVLSVLLLLASVFTVSASGGAEGEGSEGSDLHIGIAAANFDDKWMSYMHDGMRAAADEAGVRHTIVDGKNDPSVQQGQIDTLITQGVDAIVIVPVDASAIGPILSECEAAGIPLVAVNRVPQEPFYSRLATYVGSDEVYAGTIQMEEIARLLGGSGDVVIMHGAPGHSGAIGRTDGNHAVAEANGINVVRENTANWDRAKGLSLMENWIQTGINIDAVVSNNDEMAIGAILALEQLGLLEEIFVAGVDATPDALQFMKDGKLDVTVFQDAYGQGKGGVEAAIKAAMGETLPDRIDIPYELVTPDVVDEYLAKWGL